jgi:hypothetical protein
MKFFIIFILSFSVYAHEECETNPADKLMAWFSASELGVETAPCKTMAVPSADQMRAYIAGQSSGTFSGDVNGVQIKDESQVLADAFKDFTTAKDMFGSRIKKDLQKNFQQEFAINPACDKTLCAMEKIWGKEMALKMLYVKLKFGFNMSEFAFEESSRFNQDEMDDIIMALEDNPPHLQKLTKNQRLTMYTRGTTLPSYEGTKTQANSVVMIFDRWSTNKSFRRHYVMFHEQAHNISSYLKDMDESPDWLALTDWRKKDEDTWEYPEDGKQCFASGYGIKNPWEDFAESVTAYRYTGADFKKRCPEKYNFIKSKVMNGIEYLDAKSCLPKP